MSDQVLASASVDSSALGYGTDGQKTRQNLLSAEKVELTKAAVELLWLTCVSSALNGEELIRSNGVELLGSLLVDCMSVSLLAKRFALMFAF